MKRLLPIILAFALFLSGCNKFYIIWDPDSKICFTDGKYCLEEKDVRLIALNYKSLFENSYLKLLGNEFWNSDTGYNLNTEDYVKECFIYPECEELIVLNRIADAYKLTSSQPELLKIKKYASELYDSMSEEQKEYTGCTASSIEKVLTMYYRAALITDVFSDSQNPEVSAEEGRIVDFRVIAVKTEEEAKNIVTKLSEGARFNDLCDRYSLFENRVYSSSHKSLIKPFEEIIFSAETGSVTAAYFYNSMYYIFKIESDYNVLLSASFRQKLLAELKYASRLEEYNKTLKEYPVKTDIECFSEIALKTEIEISHFDLFDCFEEE